MSRKIGLYIDGRRFDVDVEKEFANFLEAEMKKDFSIDGNNELKTLLHGYIRKTHELYKQKKEIQAINEKISKKMDDF